MATSTVARSIVTALQARGVCRIFGVPGGGSSLDIMAEASSLGIDFVLTRTESAAVMMAAAGAELSGVLGVALTTKGPGTASAINGLAYAWLDRAPVLLLTDGFSADERGYVTHQVFDQAALARPLTKGSLYLGNPAEIADVPALLDLALTAPLGPVMIELTSETARSAGAVATSTRRAESEHAGHASAESITQARQLLAAARRPIMVVGLEARTEPIARALRQVVELLGCPVLSTYKARGVLSSAHENYVGNFTGGAAEAPCMETADLIVLCGLDPVELLRQRWRYDAPVIDIAMTRHTVHYVEAQVGLYGSIAAALQALAHQAQRSQWNTAQIAEFRATMLASLRYQTGGGLGPQEVVASAWQAADARGLHPRATVDAGAHMFSALAFWPCNAPCDLSISNGLATMAFALPAAIAIALHDRNRPVVAFTGDGGLFMCIGELSTAVTQHARIIVIVFNDASLSLIDIKQQQRQLPPLGVRWERPDFAAVMTGLGGLGMRAADAAQYRLALQRAYNHDGPVLIDVAIDPHGYPAQLRALRG